MEKNENISNIVKEAADKLNSSNVPENINPLFPDCLHTNNHVIDDLGNGYFKLHCNDCSHEWTDG